MLLYYFLKMNKLYIKKHIKLKNNTVFLDGIKDYSSGNSEFSDFVKSVYKKYGIKYGKFYKMDSLSKLGFLASELVLSENKNKLLPEETAIIFANSSSSLNTDVKYQKILNDAVPSPSVFVYTLPNIVIGEICIRNGFRGETIFFVQDEFDIDFTVNYTKAIFRDTNTKQALFAWVEISENNDYHIDMYLITMETSRIEFNEINIKNNFNYE